MPETYTYELTEFAKFYFKNIFKGTVVVEGQYEPRGLYTRVVVKVHYNEVYVADRSEQIADNTATTNVLEILDELTNRLKTQYINKLAEQENILL